jgi:hypothetical protein
MILLEDAYKKIVTFLNREKYKYIIIGGIAAGTIGEARVTGDIDVDIIIDGENISPFLDKAAKAGFKVSKKRCLESVRQTGVFQINCEDFHIDFIIASTDIELSAFKRAKTRKLYGIKALFPTPEDMILFKIIPERDKDLVDAKNIILRHRDKLDMRYLRSWATRLCDEAENMRILHTLNDLLGEK